LRKLWVTVAAIMGNPAIFRKLDHGAQSQRT